jgi:predicted DNA-binding transcriptional regulator AlpA
MAEKIELPRGRWLSPGEIAEMSGMSRSLVYKHLKNRTLPFPVYPKIGTFGQWIADSADIQDFLARSMVKPI